jgi:hypothetical protein
VCIYNLLTYFILFIFCYSYPGFATGIFLIWNPLNTPTAFKIIEKIGYKVNNILPILTNRKRPLFNTKEKDGPVTTHLSMLLFSAERGETLGWFSQMVDDDEQLIFPFQV